MRSRQRLALLVLAISAGLIIVLIPVHLSSARDVGGGDREHPIFVSPTLKGRATQTKPAKAGLVRIALGFSLDSNRVAELPSLKIHPLPPTLAQWQDPTNSGDYFAQVRPLKVGYLLWSEFPVKIYVEPVSQAESAFEINRARRWVNSVLQVVQEWNVYLPLEVSDRPELADIAIWRRNPPLQPLAGSDRPRARSAQTRYEFYIRSSADSPAILSHRFNILLSPNQTDPYIMASGRHELGHALGIWGHSPIETDVLYFSQVRNPPPISPRDINTLKRVYEQSTRLGWPLGEGRREEGEGEKGEGGREKNINITKSIDDK